MEKLILIIGFYITCIAPYHEMLEDFSRGSVFTKAGKLIASTAQDGLWPHMGLITF